MDARILEFAPAESGARAIAQPGVGTQVVLDLYDCQTRRFDDIDWVRCVMIEAAEAAGATIVEATFHKFSPWGISGVVVIAESHLAIHTWPEKHYAAVDIFTCGPNMDLDAAVRHLTRAFHSRQSRTRLIPRGEDVA